MMIIDIPLQGATTVRAGVIGSCRVYAPLGALVRGGQAKRRFLTAGVFSYTAVEAIQEFDYSRRLSSPPDRFAPLLLNRASLADPPMHLAELIDSCQVFLVEISTLDHLACGGACFNDLAIAEGIVRGSGPGAMAWFRQLSPLPSPSAVVATAIESMRAAGKAPDGVAEEILASLVRVRTRPEALGDQLARVMFAPDRRWIFQPLFDLPDRGDPKRAALRDHVTAAAAAAGAEIFDPTRLVAQAGRAVALDGGGVDAFHFAPGFLPTVGAALRDTLVGASAP